MGTPSPLSSPRRLRCLVLGTSRFNLSTEAFPYCSYFTKWPLPWPLLWQRALSTVGHCECDPVVLLSYATCKRIRHARNYVWTRSTNDEMWQTEKGKRHSVCLQVRQFNHFAYKLLLLRYCAWELFLTKLKSFLSIKRENSLLPFLLPFLVSRSTSLKILGVTIRPACPWLIIFIPSSHPARRLFMP